MDTLKIIPWLEIKLETKFIDDNLDCFLAYMKTAKQEEESYKKSANLLKARAKELLHEITTTSIAEFDTDNDEDRYRFICRVLGAYVITEPKATPNWHEAFAMFLLYLSKLVPEAYDQDLIEMSAKVLMFKPECKVIFKWDELISFQEQILAHRLLNETVVDTAKSEELWFEGKGSLSSKKGVVSVFPYVKSALSLSKAVGCLGMLGSTVMLHQEQSERLKQSEAENIDALEAFTTHFITQQRSVKMQDKAMKCYQDGDFIEVSVVSKYDGEITVKTIDSEYETVSGKLVLEQSIMYISKDIIYNNISVGDILDCQLTSSPKSTFSIYKTFTKYIAEEKAKPSFTGGDVLLGKVIRAVPGKSGQKITVFTENGIPVTCYGGNEYSIGTYVYVKLTHVDEGEKCGLIEGYIRDCAEDYFDISKSYANTVYGFPYAANATDDSPASIPWFDIEFLTKILFSHQRTVSSPTERYRTLCICRVLSELIENQQDRAYLDFSSQYLYSLMAFAKGQYENIKPLSICDGEECSDVQAEMIEIIKALQCMTTKDQEVLDRIIDEAPSALTANVAMLIQTCTRIDSIVPEGMISLLKQRINIDLSLVGEKEMNLTEETGTYVGMEDGSHEFKTSAVFPPDNNMQPNPGVQMETIMKSICGFLNSDTGGTLYLGVNDSGYVCGVDNDLSCLGKNMDAYVRYILDAAKEQIGLPVVQAHVHPKITFDGRVVEFHVAPYEYGVVKLNDKEAYVRFFNETVKMPERTRIQLEGKRAKNREKQSYESNIGTLIEAIRKHSKCMFHKYASSSSGLRSRCVEPFEFDRTLEYVWCYDIDDSANKFFKISRIGNVECMNKDWTHTKSHRSEFVDIFHMTGKATTPVTLHLDIMATNLIKEEFPESVEHLTMEPTGGSILSTNICKMSGLGRFYIGLASHIDIISAPGLKEYVEEYKDKSLK